jgi:hypothetical protein
MKTLFFIFMLLSFTVSAQQTQYYYCIQIMSTKNIELVKPEHVIETLDTAYIEKSGKWNRIMFVYPDDLTAWVYLHSWQRSYPDAFIVRRTKKQVEKMQVLFANI